MTTPRVLGQRALNRALLGRQHLLTRNEMSALAMMEHLVGMQAQAPLASYIGLWSRLDGFQPGELAELMTSRRAVRSTLMRGTIHLASSDDALVLRPLMLPVVERGFRGHFAQQIAEVEVEAVAAFGAKLMAERPQTRVQLRKALGKRWPEWDANAMAYAVSYLVGAVQVTPRGVWGQTGPAALTTIESWLGQPVDAAPSIDDVVLRYIAAFGPASVADIQAWSGLTRLREVVDRLELERYASADGTELYDVPDRLLPDPDSPAPVRFLPEYDNVLLSHADRSRVIPHGRRVPLPPGSGAAIGTVLVDGLYQADWRLERSNGAAAMRVEPFRALAAAERDDLTAEAARLLDFVAPDATTHDVRLV